MSQIDRLSYTILLTSSNVRAGRVPASTAVAQALQVLGGPKENKKWRLAVVGLAANIQGATLSTAASSREEVEKHWRMCNKLQSTAEKGRQQIPDMVFRFEV